MAEITSAGSTGKIEINSQASKLTYAARTDVGLVREHNEDSLVAYPPLFAVCDGMGGHEAGEVASRIAVETLVKEAPSTADGTGLEHAIIAANHAVIDGARTGEGRPGMGTTCTSLIIEGNRLVIGHVGDSRAYLLRDGELIQLTQDHSLVADLVRQGRITREESRVHPQRSVITRALGSDPNMLPDIYEFALRPGDRLLINSDGLSSMITDASITTILSGFDDVDECADELVKAALQAGGHDNVTVIVIDLPDDLPISPEADEGGTAAMPTAGEASAATPDITVSPTAGKDATDKTAKQPKRRKTSVIAFVVALVAIIAAATGGTYAYARHVAFLTTDDSGYVTVYQGFPDDIAGVSLRWYVKTTDIKAQELPQPVQERLTQGIKVGSLDDADSVLTDYREQIAEQQVAQNPATSTVTTSTTSSAASTVSEDSARTAQTTSEQNA